MTRLAREAKNASQYVAVLSNREKNRILKDMAKELVKNTALILRENAKDLKGGKQKGLSQSLMDRLMLSESRVDSMAKAIIDVVKLDDPIGKVLKDWKRPNKLRITRVSVPLGVVLVIYESRPNVTAECVSLSLKSGNSIILKGGSEAYYSNKVLASIFQDVLKKHNVPVGAVSFVNTTERKAVDVLVGLHEYISVAVPRGGEG